MMPQAPRARSPLPWTIAQYALVIGTSALLMFWKLGATALDGHEAYVAVAARNMVTPDHWLNPDIADGPIPANTALNHWLIPVYNGEPRLVKTPLAYWCVAGLMKLGLPADEFTARLPSALAAMALAAVVLALGRSMFSPRAAVLGALMLATSLALIDWGRNARADMQMTCWMAVAMACFYWAMRQASAWRRHLLILATWAALGLANLAKELVPLFLLLPPVLYLCWRASCEGKDSDRPRTLLVRYLLGAAAGFAVCLLVRPVHALHWWTWVGLGEGEGMMVTMGVTLGSPILIYMLSSRVWRAGGKVLPGTVAGGVLMLAIFLPWVIYVADVVPKAEQVFRFQTADRALGTAGWASRSATFPVGYYPLSLVKWSLPWVVFLPGALAIPLMKRWREDRDALVFLLLWVFALVLLFSTAAGKHEQYILPAMPAACLLMGYCAEDVFFNHRWISLTLARAIVVGYAGAVLLAGAAGLEAMTVVQPGLAPYVRHLLLVASVALLPAWLGVLAIFRQKGRLAVAMLVLAVAVGELAFASRQTLWGGEWENYAHLGRAIAKEAPPEAELLAWARPDPAIIWYSGRELPLARRQRDRLIRIHGSQLGEQLWRQGLTSSPRPVYMFAGETDARELSELGVHPTAVTGATANGYCLFRLQAR